MRWRPLIESRVIPVAERGGLIDDLSDLLLRQTCDQLHAIAAAGMGHMSIAMNLSARQFRAEDLSDRILRVVDEKAVEPRRLVLEITESLLMQDPKAAQVVLSHLRREGIRVVLDDFGMGYSSPSYLKNFEVDDLKIDRAFVANLPDERRDAAVLRAIISVARELTGSVRGRRRCGATGAGGSPAQRRLPVAAGLPVRRCHPRRRAHRTLCGWTNRRRAGGWSGIAGWSRALISPGPSPHGSQRMCNRPTDDSLDESDSPAAPARGHSAAISSALSPPDCSARWVICSMVMDARSA